MNVKLHTPKSMKAGSGMSSLKQFLLSIFATTVSIALTFGTAAIIDGNKKQKEKREIVMMVMFDMYSSLQSAREIDSLLRQSMTFQTELAKDTTGFDSKRFKFVRSLPYFKYTEATEHIFSSSIETINTVGNVVFTQNVAEFYQDRRLYKTMVCDSVFAAFEHSPMQTLKHALDFDYLYYALQSNELLTNLNRCYSECKLLMNVSDRELEAYRTQRERMAQSMTEYNDSAKRRKEMELLDLFQKKTEAQQKLNLK